MDPEIPILGIHPIELKTGSNRYLHTHVHSIIHNNQKVEITYVHAQMNG
jgi:hypothetical protein